MLARFYRFAFLPAFIHLFTHSFLHCAGRCPGSQGHRGKQERTSMPPPALELRVWRGSGEQCSRRTPPVQKSLFNPEGVSRPKMLPHNLGLKPAVFSDLSSIPRGRYISELELTMLSSKELQQGKASQGREQNMQNTALRSTGPGSRARQEV